MKDEPRRDEHFASRAADLQKPAVRDESFQVVQPFARGQLPPGPFARLNLRINQRKFARAFRQPNHLRRDLLTAVFDPRISPRLLAPDDFLPGRSLSGRTT